MLDFFKNIITTPRDLDTKIIPCDDILSRSIGFAIVDKNENILMKFQYPLSKLIISISYFKEPYKSLMKTVEGREEIARVLNSGINPLGDKNDKCNRWKFFKRSIRIKKSCISRFLGNLVRSL